MEVIIKMACAGRDLTLSNWFAPRCCDTIEDIALLVWPNTQISIDKNVPTIPTAAKDSVALISILPMIAVSVNDSTGSEIPAINAGIANRFMFFMESGLVKESIRNNKMGVHFAWGKK